ncbi:hypothetical protein J6590_027037 [Homalodisca vitripennis]|nr:hypothetical protein J6590_027037 [Homalodisca vitripennis]
MITLAINNFRQQLRGVFTRWRRAHLVTWSSDDAINLMTSWGNLDRRTKLETNLYTHTRDLDPCSLMGPATLSSILDLIWWKLIFLGRRIRKKVRLLFCDFLLTKIKKNHVVRALTITMESEKSRIESLGISDPIWPRVEKEGRRLISSPLHIIG